MSAAHDDGRAVAIVCEHLAWFGGNGRLTEAIARKLPAAGIHALEFDLPRASGPPHRFSFAGRVRGHPVGAPNRRLLAPSYAWRVSRFDLGDPAVVLALGGHGWTLAAPLPPGARMLAYYSGPAPSLYTRREGYLSEQALPARAAFRLSMPALRAHDRRLLRRPHRLATTSTWSAREIERIHSRPAEVLHPGIRLDLFTPGPPGDGPGEYALMVTRLTAHKRVAEVMEAFREMPKRRLVIAGTGQIEAELRAAAPANVSFAGFVPDEELVELYRGAAMLVHPSPEEFGMVMAEAQACGTPVIGAREGGALDIIEEGATGTFTDGLRPGDIRDAIDRLDAAQIDPVACRASAERFSEERFLAGLIALVDAELELVRRGRSAGGNGQGGA